MPLAACFWLGVGQALPTGPPAMVPRHPQPLVNFWDTLKQHGCHQRPVFRQQDQAPGSPEPGSRCMVAGLRTGCLSAGLIQTWGLWRHAQAFPSAQRGKGRPRLKSWQLLVFQRSLKPLEGKI